MARRICTLSCLACFLLISGVRAEDRVRITSYENEDCTGKLANASEDPDNRNIPNQIPNPYVSPPDECVLVSKVNFTLFDQTSTFDTYVITRCIDGVPQIRPYADTNCDNYLQNSNELEPGCNNGVFTECVGDSRLDSRLDTLTILAIVFLSVFGLLLLVYCVSRFVACQMAVEAAA